MSDARIRKGARLIREADDVLLHAGPQLLAGTDLPAEELATAAWGRPAGSFTHEQFEESPERVWADWLDFWDDVPVSPATADPQPVHERIAELVEAGHVSTVITENVFGLLRRAGVPVQHCIEFHGRADTARCEYCDRSYDATPRRTSSHRRCPACGGTLRPGIVLGGEAPERRDRLLAYARAESCDLYVAAGTRLAVEPTVENAEHAVETGSDLLVIGERPTAIGGSDYRLHDDPTGALARLRDALTIMGCSDN